MISAIFLIKRAQRVLLPVDLVLIIALRLTFLQR